MKKILIIENDNKVSFTLRLQLEKQGFEVFQIFNGAAALRKIINVSPDCILLNVSLPDKSGYDICAEIRAFYKGGIIFLSDGRNPSVEVTCFELGADDFILKSAPFSVLFERIKRLGIRPPEIKLNHSLTFDGIMFMPTVLDCTYKDRPIKLTQEEYELFLFIAINRAAPVSRQLILQVLKGTNYDGFERSIDIKVARIRSKLKKAGFERIAIYSVRSKGYQFALTDDEPPAEAV